MPHKKKSKLNENLRSKDLKNFVSEIFTVDQYKSKMGEDQDIVVLGFRVKEKYPATDLMEFLEKGYPFILDADMSTGEEQDGQYQVFVELERTPRLAEQMKELLNDISKLTDNKTWSYKYYKTNTVVAFDPLTVSEHIPSTPKEYNNKLTEMKGSEVKEFFNQGSIDVALESDNTLTFSKPYSGNLGATLIAIGDYDKLKDTVPGALSLDETSQSETLFLNKYLGNYDINKVGDKFLIRNGTRAVVIQKNRW
jgi:hypothetical protein